MCHTDIDFGSHYGIFRISDFPGVENAKSADIYTDLEDFIDYPEETDGVPDETQSGETEAVTVGPTIDFAGLKEINDDCVAWIYIEDTVINYPVLQGSDNAYYLKHLIDGKWNSAGSIFMDSRVNADLSDRHSIIYGHHMKNGTMFSGLAQYKKQAYYDEHPTGLLITPEQTYQIEFFAGYVAKVNDPAWDTGFESDEDYEDWLQQAKDRSCFQSPCLLQSQTEFSHCLPAAMNSIMLALYYLAY